MWKIDFQVCKLSSIGMKTRCVDQGSLAGSKYYAALGFHERVCSNSDHNRSNFKSRTSFDFESSNVLLYAPVYVINGQSGNKIDTCTYEGLEDDLHGPSILQIDLDDLKAFASREPI